MGLEEKITKLEGACFILAQAIQNGRISGVLRDIVDLLGYEITKEETEYTSGIKISKK